MLRPPSFAAARCAVTDVLTTHSELQGANLEASRSVRQALKSQRRRLTEIVSEDALRASSFLQKLRRTRQYGPRRLPESTDGIPGSLSSGRRTCSGALIDLGCVVTDVLTTSSELRGVDLEASRSVR